MSTDFNLNSWLHLDTDFVDMFPTLCLPKNKTCFKEKNGKKLKWLFVNASLWSVPPECYFTLLCFLLRISYPVKYSAATIGIFSLTLSDETSERPWCCWMVYWIPKCLTEMLKNLWKEDSGGILNMTEANTYFWRNGAGEGDVEADTVSSSSIFFF